MNYLNVVGKLTTEIEKHLGINEKTLSEYIIELARTSVLNDFRVKLKEEGGEFPQALVDHWYSFINQMLGSAVPKTEPKIETNSKQNSH